MDVQVIGQQHFRALGKAFRQASNGAAVRRALTKAIQTELKPAQKAVQQAVEHLRVRGVSGGGSRAREQHHLTRRKRAARTGHGLRATVARATRTRVKYSGHTVGARIWVDKAAMPPGQEGLPRYLDDSRGWRHPVYGHKTRWVRQVGGEYFAKTLTPRTPVIRAAVVRHVADVLKELHRG